MGKNFKSNGWKEKCFEDHHYCHSFLTYLYKSYLSELTEVEVTRTFGYNICLDVNNLTAGDDIANSEHTMKML